MSQNAGKDFMKLCGQLTALHVLNAKCQYIWLGDLSASGRRPCSAERFRVNISKQTPARFYTNASELHTQSMQIFVLYFFHSLRLAVLKMVGTSSRGSGDPSPKRCKENARLQTVKQLNRCFITNRFRF